MQYSIVRSVLRHCSLPRGRACHESLRSSARTADFVFEIADGILARFDPNDWITVQALWRDMIPISPDHGHSSNRGRPSWVLGQTLRLSPECSSFPSCIKLGVEDAEYVLRGATSILVSPSAPIIIFEVERVMAHQLNCDPEDIERFLADFSYSLFAMHNNRWQPITLALPNNICSQGTTVGLTTTISADLTGNDNRMNCGPE